MGTQAIENRPLRGSDCRRTSTNKERVKRALDAGAREQQPLEDKFYGDRMGTVKDPFGHEWSIGTHIEDVSPEEMQRRMAAMPVIS